MKLSLIDRVLTGLAGLILVGTRDLVCSYMAWGSSPSTLNLALFGRTVCTFWQHVLMAAYRPCIVAAGSARRIAAIFRSNKEKGLHPAAYGIRRFEHLHERDGKHGEKSR